MGSRRRAGQPSYGRIESPGMSDRSHQLEFVVASGTRQFTRCLLQPGEYRIGQDPKNEITVDEPSISAQHAKLTMVDEHELYLEDLNSINGTYVDGDLAAEATPISTESAIQLGACTARLRF